MRRILFSLIGAVVLATPVVASSSVASAEPARPHPRPGSLYVGRSLDPAAPGAETMMQLGARAGRVTFFTATLACADGTARQVLLRARVARDGSVSGASGTTSLTGRLTGRGVTGSVTESSCGSASFKVRRVGATQPRSGVFHGKSTAVDSAGRPYHANLSLAAANPHHIAVLGTSMECTASSDEVLLVANHRITASGAFAFRDGADIVAGRVLSRRHVRVVASDPGPGCRSTVAVLSLRRQG